MTTTELACEIIATGMKNYHALPPGLRRDVADKVPPHIIERGLKEIINFLSGSKKSFHYVLIV